MEKEIKVRKKRFAAFWITVLLVCSLTAPMVVRAMEVPSINQTVAAGAEISVPSVTYCNQDGTNDSSDNAGSSGVITIKDYTELFSDTPTGQEFQHWTVTKIYESSGVVAGVTLTPVFALGKYTITFDTVGGSAIDPISQEYNTAVTAPAPPAKTGYTFAGWDKKIPSAMPAGDMTITAQWTINQYTITFNTAGGNEIPPITQNYGTEITAPGNPSRGNDYFMGWDMEIPTTMPAENITITAKWTPYIIDAGTYDMKQGVEYKLGSATKVSGDSSTYASGIVFYVPADGSYTFS